MWLAGRDSACTKRRLTSSFLSLEEWILLHIWNHQPIFRQLRRSETNKTRTAAAKEDSDKLVFLSTYLAYESSDMGVIFECQVRYTNYQMPGELLCFRIPEKKFKPCFIVADVRDAVTAVLSISKERYYWIPRQKERCKVAWVPSMYRLRLHENPCHESSAGQKRNNQTIG